MLRQAMPFADILGIEVVSASSAEVIATAEWSESRTTAGGVVHGGFLMAVADSVGALLAFLNVPLGATTSTIESKTNFLRPVSGGTITFTSTPVNIGSQVVVVQTDIVRADQKLAARTIQTQIVRQEAPRS